MKKLVVFVVLIVVVVVAEQVFGLIGAAIALGLGGVISLAVIRGGQASAGVSGSGRIG